jgi:hypothetical protein
VLDELPNTFEELNRVRCFNHTIQLSAKALLKPFHSAGSVEADNEIKYDDDGMPALQAVDDEEEEDEDEEGDPGLNDDGEEEEDPLGALDDNEREQLINDTEAVRTTLNKVCLSASVFFCLHAHVCCCYRFANSPLPLSILPPLLFLHGVRPVPLILFACDLSLVM